MGFLCRSVEECACSRLSVAALRRQPRVRSGLRVVIPPGKDEENGPAVTVEILPDERRSEETRRVFGPSRFFLRVSLGRARSPRSEALSRIGHCRSHWLTGRGDTPKGDGERGRTVKNEANRSAVHPGFFPGECMATGRLAHEKTRLNSAL